MIHSYQKRIKLITIQLCLVYVSLYLRVYLYGHVNGLPLRQLPVDLILEFPSLFIHLFLFTITNILNIQKLK